MGAAFRKDIRSCAENHDVISRDVMHENQREHCAEIREAVRLDGPDPRPKVARARFDRRGRRRELE
jgi:hypothetical protein